MDILPAGIWMGQNSEKNKIKQTGYLISVVGIIASNIGLVNNWLFTPLLVLITMYFLAGSLWFPILIKPFYLLIHKIYKTLHKGKKIESNDP